MCVRAPVCVPVHVHVCTCVCVCVCIPVRTCVCGLCVHVCSYVCVSCMSLRNKQFKVHVCNQLHCAARLQHYQQRKGASMLPFILLLR